MQSNDSGILRIGGRGRWPGNDFALLTHTYALSSHEVSADPATCWNLAPAGSRGVTATLFYLRALHVHNTRHVHHFPATIIAGLHFVANIVNLDYLVINVLNV